MTIGEPFKCGMCGKGMIPGLAFNGRPARQATTPVGNGRIHIDRELCKALERMTDDELAKKLAPNIHTTGQRGTPESGGSHVLHSVASMELDQDVDGGRSATVTV